MKPQKLFTLHDVKAENYSAPTCHASTGQALRSFSDAVNAKEGILATHAEDFTLFEIGEFDTCTGVITLYDAKKAIANGVDVKQSV